MIVMNDIIKLRKISVQKNSIIEIVSDRRNNKIVINQGTNEL